MPLSTFTLPTFTLLVSKSPFDYRNAENALLFCHSALAQGHQIDQVFFYQSGVQNASQLQSPNHDEINIYKRWCEFHQTHKICLNVCVTAAARRGVVDNSFSDQANLVAPFTQVGLSAYFEALANNTINIQL